MYEWKSCPGIGSFMYNSAFMQGLITGKCQLLCGVHKFKSATKLHVEWQNHSKIILSKNKYETNVSYCKQEMQTAIMTEKWELKMQSFLGVNERPANKRTRAREHMVEFVSLVNIFRTILIISVFSVKTKYCMHKPILTKDQASSNNHFRYVHTLNQCGNECGLVFQPLCGITHHKSESLNMPLREMGGGCVERHCCEKWCIMFFLWLREWDRNYSLRKELDHLPQIILSLRRTVLKKKKKLEQQRQQKYFKWRRLQSVLTYVVREWSISPTTGNLKMPRDQTKQGVWELCVFDWGHWRLWGKAGG